MSTSVLRRYTPPTCTLEIAATGSALSRWTDRAVLKNLRFQLSLDDPKLPEEKQVTLRGDRTQLEALWGAVTAYVQSQLSVSPHLPLQSAADYTFSEDALLVQPQAIGKGLSEKTGIRLQSRGLVSHELHLGTLATEQSGAMVSLSALQLFDLANVLDEYHAEAMTLPALGRPAWLKSPSRLGSVAAVLLLAIGATAAVTKFVTDVSAPSPQLATAPANDNPIGVEAPKSSTRLPSPPGLEPLPPSLALQPLPPPPPVGKTTAPPVVSVPQTSAAPAQTAGAGEVAVLPQPSLVPTQPNVLAVPSQEAAGTAPANSTPTEPDIVALSRTSQSAAPQPEALRPDSTATNSSTAFDAIPQVAEVRDYFQQAWQPPPELSQTLEYRLLLNTDGSIQRIVPLGQAAATFLDRTNMPLMNEPFVSPVTDGKTPQIRLVLGRDGRVQTFLEAN
ncbi:DUF4335 domain-containing protein [Phormidium tenue FACHB-886]|nr:DUF4335 domain-containing protein [Phormidium tenue FACHB-886]